MDQIEFTTSLIKMLQSNLLNQLTNQQQLQLKEDYVTLQSLKSIIDIRHQITFQMEQAMTMLKIVDQIQQNEELLMNREKEKFKQDFEIEFEVEFKLTPLAYDLQIANYDDICQKNFGQDYRVAEWSDLEDIIYQIEDNKIDQFIQYIGFSQTQNDFAIKYNGSNRYSQSRYYFASWHNHKKPHLYLAHDNIDNFLLSLGSWVGSKRILCIKENKINLFEGHAFQIPQQSQSNELIHFTQMRDISIHLKSKISDTLYKILSKEFKDKYQSLVKYSYFSLQVQFILINQKIKILSNQYPIPVNKSSMIIKSHIMHKMKQMLFKNKMILQHFLFFQIC